jgi:hypothetical protein
MTKFRLPDDTKRLSIVGRTGTGKTLCGIWHLSNRSYDTMPWIVYDFKRDKSLAQIADLGKQMEVGAYQISLDDTPDRPGIYFVHPHPDDIEGVREQMFRIWERENTGVFVDEGYMVCGPKNPNPAFRTLLTQGRSKHIPMIILSQRPVWMDLFVFTESDFYQVFALNSAKDRRTMNEYIPDDVSKTLPDFHSYYHDVGRGETFVMRPVPDEKETLDIFARKFEAMKPKRRTRVI